MKNKYYPFIFIHRLPLDTYFPGAIDILSHFLFYYANIIQNGVTYPVLLVNDTLSIQQPFVRREM